ncbi:MAG: hypothetical protein ACREA2_22730 [Blastocatellia bacterium]
MHQRSLARGAFNVGSPGTSVERRGAQLQNSPPTKLPPLAPPSSPTPSPAPMSQAGSSLPQFFDKLIGRAGALVPMLQNEIEGPLLPWLENLSWWLAVLVIIFGFGRLWRENSGAGPDLFWWFGRIAIIFALAGSGPAIVSKLDAIGQEIAWGGSGTSNNVLYRFYNNHRKSFEEGYRRFTKGHFTVEPTGERLKPLPGGEEAVLGVIRDVVASPKDVNNKFETLSRDMPFLFSILSFARGILAFGDLYLLALGGFLMIAVRLAAPVMIALAIDRNLANKISYPFLWGTIVLTLIWPVVSQLIRAFAYMGGNLAISLDASDAVYQWDPQTMGEIMTSGAEPFYTVILAIVIMTIAGLSLWMSPVIAYKVAMGQVYESVSSTVSSWAGALVGAGIELYSSAIAASISNQAERAQAQGQYLGEMTRAGTAYDVGRLNALANRIRSITGIEGNRISSVEGIYGGLTRATGAINTEMQYGNETAAALAMLNTNDIRTLNQQAIVDLNADRGQQSANIETNRAADTQHFFGGKIIKGSEWAGGAARTLFSDAQSGKQTLTGRAAGSVIEIGGGVVGLGMQYRSIQNRAAGQQLALNEAFNTRIANQERSSRYLAQNQEVYRGEIVGANQRRAQGLTAAEIAGANQAVAGANRGAAVATGGVTILALIYSSGCREMKMATAGRDASGRSGKMRGGFIVYAPPSLGIGVQQY